MASLEVMTILTHSLVHSQAHKLIQILQFSTTFPIFAYRQISGKSQTYLRQISGKNKANLGQSHAILKPILCKSWTNLNQISGFVTNHWQILGNPKVNLLQISRKSQTNLGQILGKYCANLRTIKYRANFWQMSGKCLANVWQISDNSQANFRKISGKSKADLEQIQSNLEKKTCANLKQNWVKSCANIRISWKNLRQISCKSQYLYLLVHK